MSDPGLVAPGLAGPSIAGPSLAELLREGAEVLRGAGIEEPRRDARLLLSHATGLEGAALLQSMKLARPAPGYGDMVGRRAGREPLAYILGEQAFWTLELWVSPDTLIPRADSETLIEEALALFPKREVRRVLDLGTGTGCLLLAALMEFGSAHGVGVDRVEGAVRLAAANAGRAGLADRAGFVCGDWAAAVAGPFDLVLANPPYIDTPALGGLMPEVAWYEPMLALDGGHDGLAAYRAIAAALPGLLAPDGVAILELGAGQSEAVAAIGREAGLRPLAPRRDLGHVERALALRPGGRKRLANRAGASRFPRAL